MRNRRFVMATVSSSLLCAGTALALDFDTGSEDLKIRWDNSVKYSAAFRLKAPSAALAGDPNQGDGDSNFGRRGLVSNRLDLLSDLDVIYQGSYGLRVSGAAWYDEVYNHGTHNSSPAWFYNPALVPSTEFPAATRKEHGRKAELLDAFLFGKGETAGGMRWSVRAGRHTLVWGETLFFGANGIAGGQAPVDVVKLLSVPNSQFKEILRPTGALSGTLQLTPDVLLGAYVQYEWERTRLPGVGSYFSTEDLFDEGGERFFLGGPVLARGPDTRPRNGGQGGLQLRFRLPSGQTDYGLYAIRCHEKTPNLYLNIPIGTYSIAYQQGVSAFGLSASRTFGDVNLAAEASVRHHASLANDGTANFSGAPPAEDQPLYPVGSTAHLNVSAIWTLPSTAVFREATLMGELGWNRRLSVSNGGVLAAHSTRDAYGLRMVFTPTFRQVFPGMDLNVPVGLGYNPRGASQAVSAFNGGVNKGGDFSIGLAGNYLNTWNLGLNVTHYLGSTGTTLENAQLSFKQDKHDRDFISLSVQTTF
ncbi:DUF1302 domain-containing protein [Pelomonas sp. KK5]|uniref:DUF1302 domain-containing protein n=1 Tax=Pelomonas sp. KK5 TaxID=1855730 RepID=UPI001E557B06|nr:DUF1302 family protein [Pelomonas sp. KK5]